MTEVEILLARPLSHPIQIFYGISQLFLCVAVFTLMAKGTAVRVQTCLSCPHHGVTV